jgi:hypothetical protein
MKTHAKQVAAWGKLLGHCNALGATFNPGMESMKGTALTLLLTEAQKSIEAVHEAQAIQVDAINVRNRAFDELPFLGTRIISAVGASGAPPDYLADVNRIRLRFRYQPLKGSALKTRSGEQTEQTNGVDIPPAGTPRRPVSYLGFDNKIENLAELIGLLKKESRYIPNEDDLSVESLEAFLAELRQKHTAVSTASMALYSARQHCKKMLFANEGIYGSSVRVKKYIQSVFGYKSEQYQVVHKIRFKK